MNVSTSHNILKFISALIISSVVLITLIVLVIILFIPGLIISQLILFVIGLLTIIWTLAFIGAAIWYFVREEPESQKTNATDSYSIDQAKDPTKK